MKTQQKWSLYGMSTLYFLAGINHFFNPDFYAKLLESRFSHPFFWVYLSGFFEVGLAISILFSSLLKRSSSLICWMLFVFLCTVHLPMLFETNFSSDSVYWILVLRIPIQFILIFWAYSLRKIA